jgi:hypothetical protein
MQLNNLYESEIFFYNEIENNDYIKISPNNPHTTSAITIDEQCYPEIDYKNYTRVYIKKITYLKNNEFYKAYRIQILASIIMCSIIINFLYSLWYFNYRLLWLIPIETLIFSIAGIYAVKNFEKNKIFYYIIYLLLNSIIKIISLVYIDLVYTSIIIIILQLFIDISISIILYYFYNYLF